MAAAKSAGASSNAAGKQLAARYAPLAQPGTPGRWNDEAILRALREWTEEMCRPPRRQEWCGEQPHNAPPGRRKWMREHPYWPSSSCVADHFGSWSEALHAAGLIERAFVTASSIA
jgi:Homing endonuclease associated repeat